MTVLPTSPVRDPYRRAALSSPRVGDCIGQRWQVTDVSDGSDGAAVLSLVLLPSPGGTLGEANPGPGSPGGTSTFHGELGRALGWGASGIAELNRALAPHLRWVLGCSTIPIPEVLEAEPSLLVWRLRLAPWPFSLAGPQPMERDRLGRWVLSAVRALRGLHDQGLAHGSLRWEFIGTSEVSEPGEPVEAQVELGGFPGAAMTRELFGAEAQASLLPARYRAPELREAPFGAPTPSSDAFALGVLIRELIEGKWAKPEEPTAAGAIPPLICWASGQPLDSEVAGLLGQIAAESPQARPADLDAWATAFVAALHRPTPVCQPQLQLPAEVAESAEVPLLAPASLSSAEPSAAPPAPGSAASPTRLPEPSPAPSTRRISWGAVALLMGLALLVPGVGAVFVAALHSRAEPDPSALAAVPSELSSKGTGAPAPSSGSDGLPPASATGPMLPEPSGSVASEDRERPRDWLIPLGPRPNASAAEAAASPYSEEHVPPAQVRAALPIDDAVPALGRPRAAVTAVIFGDLDCPDTRKMVRVLLRELHQAPRDLRLVWRHRPLAVHGYASTAAAYFAALHRSGGNPAFWRLLELTSRSAQGLNRDLLEQGALGVGSSAAQVNAAWRSSLGEAQVVDDLRLATVFNVRQTPTVFINGMRVIGPRTPAEIHSLIEDERRRALLQLAQGTPETELYGARVGIRLLGLSEEAVPRRCPRLGRSPSRGAEPALLTLVEFSDFQCPFCRQSASRVLEFAAHAEARLVWKALLMPQHSEARPRAEYALEALAQGGSDAFWRFHDGLFAAPEPVDGSALGELAISLGLNETSLRQRAAAGRRAHESRLQEDAQEAKRLGVTGTPTFFLNGRRLDGLPSRPEWLGLVKQERAAAQRLVAHGIPPAEIYGTFCGAEKERSGTQ